VGRRSSRREHQRFVVEGAVLINEALSAGWIVESEYLAPGAEPVSQAQAWNLAPGVLERVSDTESPRGQIAVVRRREISSADLTLETAEMVLVADRIADPGNLGTMVRSAEAAGVDAIVVTDTTTDPFGPKAVRASAGAVFHVGVVEAGLNDVARAGLRLLALSSHRGVDHSQVDYTGRIAIVIGNEAQGLDGTAWGSIEPEWVTIVHHGRSESLNAAMAATVVVFEATRQRDRPGR